MTWARLDDGILENAKVAAAGPLGFALHVAGIVYCARNLTDGFVPYGHARRLLAMEWTVEHESGNPQVWELAGTYGMGGYSGPELVDRVIAALEACGLWEQVPHGYLIHDYLDYNPTKDQVLSERAAKQAAGKAGGEAAARARARTVATAVAKARAKAKRLAESKPVPVPVPEPVPEASKAPLLHIALPDVVPFEEQPETKLAVWWQEFNAGQISEYDKQAAAAFVVDYPRLGLAGIQARITEHAQWRRENEKKPLGRLEFYRDTLNGQEEHLADSGVTRPRAGAVT